MAIGIVIGEDGLVKNPVRWRLYKVVRNRRLYLTADGTLSGLRESALLFSETDYTRLLALNTGWNSELVYLPMPR